MPGRVLADRMGCQKGDRMGCTKAGVVANVVLPARDHVRSATTYGFRPDFCEAHAPESKSKGLSANSGRTLQRFVAEVVVLSDESFERT